MIRLRPKTVLGASAALVLAAGFCAAPAYASGTFTIAGVSCTLHSQTTGTYNSMYCSTSQSYHFTSSACKTSCTTVSSDTNSNNRLVKLCAPSGSGLSNTLTVYFGSSNKGNYTVARDNTISAPC